MDLDVINVNGLCNYLNGSINTTCSVVNLNQTHWHSEIRFLLQEELQSNATVLIRLLCYQT